MRFQKIGYDLISTLKSDDNYDELCDAEIEILDKVDKQYDGKDWKYLVDKAIHKFPEWRKVQDKAKNCIPIPILKRKISSALDMSEKKQATYFTFTFLLNFIHRNLAGAQRFFNTPG